MKRLVIGFLALAAAAAGAAPLDPVRYVKDELARGAKTVRVPAGRYFITPDGRDETVYFRLADLRDVTLDFGGAELVGTVRTRMFDLRRCTNVTVRNVSIDFRELPFTQAVIERVDAARNWDVRIAKGYPRPDMRVKETAIDNHDDFWPIQAYDGRSHELKNPMRYLDGVAIVRTGDDTYRITGGKDRRGEVGDIAVWSVKERGRPVEGENVNAVGCADLVFEDVVQYATPHGRAFIDWSSANTTYLRCKVVRRPPETDLAPRALPRLRSGNHDAFISKNAAVGPKIIDCVAEYHCDDCVNISGAYQVIYEGSGNRVRVFVHGLWDLQIGAGDLCEVLTPDGRTPAGVRVVSVAEGPAIAPAESAYLETIGLWPGIARGMRRSYWLTLDRAVDFPRGTLLASESRMGNGFVIRGCRFGSTRARGLLVKASHGVIENCDVDRPVCFTTEYDWLSAGIARDVVLRNNRFRGKVFFGGRAARGKPIDPAVNTGIVEEKAIDNLWMWGHHPDSLKAMNGTHTFGLPAVTCGDMADACRRMGIGGCFLVRWHNLPTKAELPKYVEQFRSLPRLGFSITDGAVESFDEKVRLGLELAEKLPNLRTFVMDDYWCSLGYGQPVARLKALKTELARRGIKLAVVLYSDTNGLKDEFREVLDLCDEVTYWFWNGRNTGGIEDSVDRLRAFVGPRKPILLGQYMWDFGGRKPMPPALMRDQLAQTRRLIDAGKVAGVIFHCTILVGMDLEAVGVSREWIAARHESRTANIPPVACTTHAVTLDGASRGAVASLVTTSGVQFASATPRPLFQIELRSCANFTNVVTATPDGAEGFAVEPLADGVRLVYTRFRSAPLVRVACTVRAAPGEDRLRWRIATAPQPGWAVTEAAFPQLALTPSIGASPDDDAILTGASFKAGLVRRPFSGKGFGVNVQQPGALGVQMACYCDPRALLLFACEDGRGEVKRLFGQRVNGKSRRAIDLAFGHRGWRTAAETLPYDVVTVTRTATAAEEPLTWHDGADLYRAWAQRQRWCATPWKFRRDIPAWLRGKPAYGSMGSPWRDWMDRPGALERWARDFFRANYPDATVAVHFDGWERNGVYNMTHYFPLYPNDEAFRRYAEVSRANGVLVFPWPSGWRRSDAYDRRDDGTFAVDERAAFARDFLPHACKNPDGSMNLAHCKWMRGGRVGTMCGGDPWTLDWFARDICGELARRGVPAVSCDQNIGGAFPACWDRAHPHPPGVGRWMTDAIRRQPAMALAALRAKFPEAAFCFEEPNEQINDTVTFNNVREAYNPEVEWTGLFNYLYHEYAPIYPLGGMYPYARAYLVAVGVMPRIVGAPGDIAVGTPAMTNGGFEEMSRDGLRVRSWETGPKQLPNRPDDAERHAGRFSIRVERPDDTNRWTHVATCLSASDDAFAPGRRMRLGAWMKVARGGVSVDLMMACPGAMDTWARVTAGRDATNWVHRTADFTCPSNFVKMVRIMLNAPRNALGWVDDLTLDEVLSDGSTRPLLLAGDSRKIAGQRRWLDLYGGEGREFLAYGRRVKPPVLDCEKIPYGRRTVDAVLCGAYVSQDGRRAWLMANGTDRPQTVRWHDKARDYVCSLASYEFRLVPAED